MNALGARTVKRNAEDEMAGIMIDTLRKLVESLERLPEQQQEAARRIEPILEDLSASAWDELLATPESLAFLDELAAEADAERVAGLLIDLDAALEAEE
jgi:hypothetical protein